MKNVLLFLFLLLVPSLLYAQHEADNWYFGIDAGVNFSTGSPVVLTDGQTATVEGTAVMSTSAGDLLFYTDGVTVWNKLQNIMTNGFGLHGGNSSSQSALIVQMPGSDSLYYIFTVGESGSGYGFQYSIVDMSLQSGNGEVILKNILVLGNTNEQLTATRHSNGTDFWVLVHTTSTNSFYAYQFSASGLNATPVISNIGSLQTSEIGYMKASHHGKQIAVSSHYDLFFELLDFDNSTGDLSNPVNLGCPPVVFGPYGIEFSPNDSLLYGAPFEPPVILQWDISSGIAAQIISSEIAIDTASSIDGGALQLAPDGKIYMAKYSTQYLTVINNPNVYGTGCNFVDNGFSLAPELCQAGLPNFLPEMLGTSSLPAASFASSDSSVCGVTCINFTDMSVNIPTSWQWSFPGAIPSSSTDQNPTNICYNTSGSYDVTLIVSNASGSDTIVLSNFITIYPAPSIFISQSNDTLFATTAQNYQWYNNGNIINGATDFFYTPSSEGNYSVIVIDSTGCSASDSIFFTIGPLSNFSTSDTIVCQKFCLDFTDLSGNSPTSWHWIFDGGAPSFSFSQNPSNICYNTPGTYDVTLITTNANGADTLVLSNYITVNPTPPFPTISQVGYTLTSSPATSYQWQFNSVDIPGATNQSYTIMQTGYYTVVVTDANGCVNSAITYVLISGIDNPGHDANISIYPNPSSGNFMVEWLNGLIAGEVSIDIINTVGQIIYSSTESRSIGTSKFKKEINLGDVARGIYFVEIKTENEFVIKKIVIAE